MLELLLVGRECDSFQQYASLFKDYPFINLYCINSGQFALEELIATPFDLVVACERLIDMTALEFAEELIKQNPMITIAVTSSLSKKVFHELSEGLGIISQLPIYPKQKEINKLLTQYSKIAEAVL